MSKQQQQSLMLGFVLLVVVGVLGFLFGGNLLPSPEGAELPPPLFEATAIPAENKSLYDNETFKTLRRFGSVPVQANPSGGSEEPFIFEQQ